LKNPYFVLGVEKNSSQTDIKKAYQKLARRYHPDKNIGDEQRVAVLFQEVKTAYETLSNPVKQREYDESERNALVDDPFKTAQELWTSYIDRLVATAWFFASSQDDLPEHESALLQEVETLLIQS
jgi:curved DNA-binding protein CbpA